jgi:hypothetical protein
MFGGLFFKVLKPLYFGGCNFVNSNQLLTIFNMSTVPLGGVQVWFEH